MKKSYLSLALIAAAALSSGAAMAQSAKPVNGTQASPYTFELGLTTHRETYEEFSAEDGGKVMRQTAPMVGLKGSVSRALGADGKVKATAQYSWGNADYTGAYMGGQYGDLHLGGLSRQLFETTAVYTHSAPAWNGFGVKGGLGYRHLVDNLQDAGPSGYKRTNDRVYAIVGVEQVLQSAHWTITPAAEYKHSLWSRHESDLLGGVKHRQHGNGGELSVAFAQKDGLTPMTIRPFYRVWNIDHSNVSQGFYEPKNETSELGIDVSWRF